MIRLRARLWRLAFRAALCICALVFVAAVIVFVLFPELAQVTR